MAELKPDERRLTLRLLAYWEKLRGGRPMPAERDIDPDDIRDLWEHCFLIRVGDLGRYTYIGQAIIEADAARLSPGYAKVIATARPVLEEGEFRHSQGHMVKYRQCLLPLGENGEIRAIFGGMRFKIFLV